MAVERTVVVQGSEGLHARPAALVVQTANRFASAVEIVARGQAGSAKSILSVLKLGVRQGDQVTIRASGEDEESAIDAVVALLAGEPGWNQSP